MGSLHGQNNCNLLFDIAHAKGADVIAEYSSEFYQGTSVVTSNTLGESNAIYVGSSAERNFVNKVLSTVCEEKSILPLIETPSEVEVTRRKHLYLS